MLVGYDNYITYLAAPATQGATSLVVKDSTVVCSSLGTNQTKLRVGDGTFFEDVRVTSCVGGVLQLAAPLQKAYTQGSCVRFVVSLAVVCELIAQGGCTVPVATAAPPPVTCARPSFVAGMPLPEFELGAIAEHAIAWDGVGPFTVSVLVKPSWMTTSVVGNVLVIGGTPPDDTAINFQATITNACGTTEINSRVCYCNIAGVTP
jgi:hypothetical protein